MKKISLRIKILNGMLCVILALSGSSISFAAVKDSGSTKVKIASSMDLRIPMDKQKLNQERQVERRATLETVIKESVADSIITQTEGDKVLEYVKTKCQKRSVENKTDKKCKNGVCEGVKGGVFTDLVTEGILTQEKSDALRERIHIKSRELRNEKIQKVLP